VRDLENEPMASRWRWLAWCLMGLGSYRFGYGGRCWGRFGRFGKGVCRSGDWGILTIVAISWNWVLMYFRYLVRIRYSFTHGEFVSFYDTITRFSE
jgi:hypothetical protein